MARLRLRTLVLAALVTWCVAGPECLAALAAKLGQPARYTARLSSNPAIRRQQLIVDPEGILGGSVSVRYDTTLVRLVGVEDPAAFDVTGGLVGVIPAAGTGVENVLLPIDSFLSQQPERGTPGTSGENQLFETGYVQIFFDRRDDADQRAAAGPSVIPNLPGFKTVDEDGATGVNDTHTLLFEYIGPPEFRAAYSIFATGPRPGTETDFIIPEDDPANPIQYTELGGAKVSGSLLYREDGHPLVPLPAGAWMGLLTMAGVAGGMAWKRRAL